MQQIPALNKQENSGAYLFVTSDTFNNEVGIIACKPALEKHTMHSDSQLDLLGQILSWASKSINGRTVRIVDLKMITVRWTADREYRFRAIIRYKLVKV